MVVLSGANRQGHIHQIHWYRKVFLPKYLVTRIASLSCVCPAGYLSSPVASRPAMYWLWGLPPCRFWVIKSLVIQ